jgi:exodeoxyribonuclease VII small subunit
MTEKMMEERKETYKEAFARLQEIHALIESNRLDVDELSGVLKEASSLLKICKEKLFVVNEETKKIIENIQ